MSDTADVDSLYLRVDDLIAEKLRGMKPHKLCVQTRGNSLQLRMDSPDLAFGEPIISVTVDGGESSLEDLQRILYITEEQKRFIGTWIHGDACRATILKCVSRVNSSHPSTGLNAEFKAGGSRHGEIHYSGPCTINFVWLKADGTKINIEVSSGYTRFWWDPLA